MAGYVAPLADIRFVLFDLLDVEPMFARLGFTDATHDILDAVLDEGARFAGSVLAPLNRVGDEAGCVLDAQTGAVTTPPGFSAAYTQYVEAGWAGLAAPVKKPAPG